MRDLLIHLNRAYATSFAAKLVARLDPTAEGDTELLIEECTYDVEAVVKRLNDLQGREIYVGEWFLVDQSKIDLFAAATDDQQWIHVDWQRAQRESPFKTTVAHGFLILSLLPKLGNVQEQCTGWFPDAKLMINCGLNNVQFLRPVKAGSAVRSRTTLLKITKHKNSVDIINRIVIEVGPFSKVVCTADATVRICL